MTMELPKFRYSPNCYDLENENFTYSEEGVLRKMFLKIMKVKMGMKLN